MIETIEQLRAAVYGQAVGDALGVPYEFQDRDSFACANMIGHGTHNQPAGTWSDDTSMMLATLDSLIGNDWQVDIEDMQHRFNAWLYDGEYAIDGNVFDCRNTVREALPHISQPNQPTTDTPTRPPPHAETVDGTCVPNARQPSTREA